MATSQPPAAPATASVWEDFIDIFTSPAEVFARRMGGGAWVPFVVFAILVAGLSFATQGLMQPIFDAEFSRAMARTPGMTADQIATAKSIGEKFLVFGGVLFVPISVGVVGLVLWLIGKMFGSKASFGDAYMVTAYSWAPRVIGFIVGSVIAVMTDPAKMNSQFSVTLSLGRFLDPDSTAHRLVMLAGRVDVFLLWQAVLIGIGLSVVGKISRKQGYLASAAVWLVFTGLALMAR